MLKRDPRLYQAAIASQRVTEELLIAYGEAKQDPMVSGCRVVTANSYLRELVSLMGFKLVEKEAAPHPDEKQIIDRIVKRIRKRAYQAPYSHRMLELAEEIEGFVAREAVE